MQSPFTVLRRGEEMSKVTCAALLLFTLAAAGCASSQVQEKTRELNKEQIEELQELQQKQLRIQTMVENLNCIHHAAVYVRENEVLIYPYFKPGRRLSLAQREKINEFVERETGLGRENIRLMVKKRKGD